jgi:hypothetical protein
LATPLPNIAGNIANAVKSAATKVQTAPKPVTAPKPLPNATAKSPTKVPLPTVVTQTAAKAPQPVKPVYTGPHINSIPQVANLLGAKYETHPTTGQPLVNGQPVKVTAMKSGEPHGPVTQVAQKAGVPTTHIQKTSSTVTIMPHQTATQPLLRQGSTGNSVKQLQQMLNAAGAHLKVDGIFGPQTEAAVRQFQQTHHLQVDGIVGPQTWGALNSYHAPAKTTASKPAPIKAAPKQPTQQQPTQQQPQAPDYGQQIADLQNQYLQQIWQSAPQMPAMPQLPTFDAQSVLNQFQPIQPFQWDAAQDFMQQYQAQLPEFQQQLATEDQRINDMMNKRGLYNSGIAQQAINQQNQALYQKLFDSIQQKSLDDQKQAFQEWLDQANLTEKQNQDFANFALNAYKANVDTLYNQGQLSEKEYNDALSEWSKMVSATQDAMDNQVKSILQSQQDAAAMQRAMLPYLYPTQNSLLPYTLGPTPYQQQQLNLDYLKTLLPYQMPTAYQQGQLNLGWAKLDAQTQQWLAQDQLRQEEIMGYDAQGKPTLARQKFDEQARLDEANIAHMEATATNDFLKTQISAIGDQLKAVNSDIASILSNTSLSASERQQLLAQKYQERQGYLDSLKAIAIAAGYGDISAGASGGGGHPLATPN